MTLAAFDCETAGRGVWYLVRATVFHGRSLLVGRVRSCDFETETCSVVVVHRKLYCIDGLSRSLLMLTVAAFDCETAGRGVWYLVRTTVFHGRSLLVGRVRSCDFETET